MLTDATQLIPQRDPFVFVDAIIASGEDSTTTSFRIPPDNILVENGFLCEAGLVENVAQTAAARLGFQSEEEGREIPLGFIAAVKNFHFHRLPQAGTTLQTKVSVVSKVFDFTLVHGTITVDDQMIAEGELKIVVPK